MALLGIDTVVTGPLAEGALLLETFQGKEALGTPFFYNVTLLADDPAIAPDTVLGQVMTIRIKLDSGAFRYFTGVVTYFAKTGITVRHTRYAAVLNPKLTLLDYTRDCRIFFNVKAPDLAGDLLSQRGAEIDPSMLKGDYRTREYLVQYRESCSNLIQRLFEEEGIYYFFKHEQGKHTMVLADSSTAHGKVAGYEAVMYTPTETTGAGDEEHFWGLSVSGALYPGKFSTLQNYDFTKTRLRSPHLENKPSAAAAPGADFEDYDNAGGLIVKGDAEVDANVRLESDAVANTTIEVEADTMGLGVGDLVTLVRALGDVACTPFWKAGDFTKEYLITSATYSFTIDQHESGSAAPSSDEGFHATYTLLDSHSQFMPRRRAFKPRIEGPQTAIVVGAGGDEIHTDKYGRVKVQFEWDRQGQNDQKSSIFVRVAQVWAGKQWGAIHIPRVGQEVIVEFLDGDPDRPIITGRVYNSENMPPYELPANMTQSGIKSRSSKGGTASNFNELRFEDKKGSEELFMQAEKDMNVLVKNDRGTVIKHDEMREVDHDRTKHVKNDETTNVDGNRTETVGKDETITIHGERTETVDKDETITISGGRTESVSKNEEISISGSRTKSVGKDESTTVGGSRSETVSKNESITISGGRTVNITKAEKLTVGDGRTVVTTGDDKLQVSKKILIDGGDEIMLKSGDASITLKKDGTIILKGKDVTITASGKINAKASSDVIIKGSKIAGN
jgi:type VI secretion system secreted protein VgrG